MVTESVDGALELGWTVLDLQWDLVLAVESVIVLVVALAVELAVELVVELVVVLVGQVLVGESWAAPLAVVAPVEGQNSQASSILV